MLDLGYDVEDFCGVNPTFGTLEDFDQLVETLHARGMRIILDFIPNHTSDQHGWFRQSRSSRSDPKRDWYVWAEPRPDGDRPTIGLAVSAAAPGNGTQAPSNIIITPSCPNSRT